MRIIILNGPNLNLTGQREPAIYGNKTFASYLPELKAAFPDIEIAYLQSNHAGHMIDVIQEVSRNYSGLVVNAGGYSHTSISMADALKAMSIPYVEVHLSNIHARESYRHTSLMSGAAKAVICGAGMLGYKWALEFLVSLVDEAEKQ